jgi:hypothetical protein
MVWDLTPGETDAGDFEVCDRLPHVGDHQVFNLVMELLFEDAALCRLVEAVRAEIACRVIAPTCNAWTSSGWAVSSGRDMVGSFALCVDSYRNNRKTASDPT